MPVRAMAHLDGDTRTGPVTGPGGIAGRPGAARVEGPSWVWQNGQLYSQPHRTPLSSG
ncbi:hypothetical protein ACJWDR_13545 [Streptomyces tauricus]|uniref:hypothetical protein n=1 Tax=Streptomyces tauricus TaxID=68274 RepID=UPI00387F2ED4